MKFPTIPEEIKDWDLKTLNKLINIIDIERDSFDFKGPDYKELCNHICAMANTPGGFIVLGIEEIPSPSNSEIIIGFRKNGFKHGKQDSVANSISNAIFNVEPVPKVEFKNIRDRNKFYTVLKIHSEDNKKPYFTKAGVCYVRNGPSTRQATRSVIMNLAIHKLVSREEIRQHTDYLKEIYRRLIGISIHYTSRCTIYLEIPDDYIQYRNRIIYLQMHEADATTYQDIRKVKHFDWAIAHMKHDEYSHIYEDWIKINSLIDQYNKFATSLINLIEKKVRTTMKSVYPSFTELKENEQWQNSNKYSVRNIAGYFFQLLSSLEDDSKPDFTELNVALTENQGLYAITKTGPLIMSQNREAIESKKLIRMLSSLYEQSTTRQRFKDLNRMNKEIYELSRRQFSKKLEALVDDLDGGDTIKGYCKLGY